MRLEKFKTYLQKSLKLSDDDFYLLTQNLKSKIIRKDDILLRQGEICHFTFFVEKGLLRSYTIDPSGKAHIIQFASENWFITDRSSSFFETPSELFIDAIEESEIVYLDSNFINNAYSAIPVFAEFNEQLLHKHILQQQRRINLLLSASAEERYLEFINLYYDLTLRVPQWMIASYLGITPESLSRVRKELAKKNFQPH